MLFIFTIFALLLWPTGGIEIWHRLLECGKKLTSFNIFRSETKEKDEDLDCEYDMIWDAEGSMHLVKRASNTPNTRSSEINSKERSATANACYHLNLDYHYLSATMIEPVT